MNQTNIMNQTNQTIDYFRGRYFFLSNFYLVFIRMDGLIYPSVEHAYQAAKTFDPDYRQYVLESPNPAIAKRRGRQCPTIRENWEEIKLDVMEELLRQKFSYIQNPELAQKLLDTFPCELIEGNSWGDVFWGVCKGHGQNHLGRLLMEIRDVLRETAP